MAEGQKESTKDPRLAFLFLLSVAQTRHRNQNPVQSLSFPSPRLPLHLTIPLLPPSRHSTPQNKMHRFSFRSSFRPAMSREQLLTLVPESPELALQQDVLFLPSFLPLFLPSALFEKNETGVSNKDRKESTSLTTANNSDTKRTGCGEQNSPSASPSKKRRVQVRALFCSPSLLCLAPCLSFSHESNGHLIV